MVKKFTSNDALLIEYQPSGAVVALDDENGLKPWLAAFKNQIVEEGQAIKLPKPASYNQEVETRYLKAMQLIKATSFHL